MKSRSYRSVGRCIAYQNIIVIIVSEQRPTPERRSPWKNQPLAKRSPEKNNIKEEKQQSVRTSPTNQTFSRLPAVGAWRTLCAGQRQSSKK